MGMEHVVKSARFKFRDVIDWLHINEGNMRRAGQGSLWMELLFVTEGRLATRGKPGQHVKVTYDDIKNTCTISNLQNGDLELLTLACEALGFRWKYEHDPAQAQLIVIGTPHPNEYREPYPPKVPPISTARAASDDEPLGAVKLMEQEQRDNIEKSVDWLKPQTGTDLEGKCGTCLHFMPLSLRCAVAYAKGDCFPSDTCDGWERKK